MSIENGKQPAFPNSSLETAFGSTGLSKFENANGWAVFAIGEACTTIPTTEHAELRRKAAMWDAHEARRIALENADSEFWAKITSIREGFGI